MAEPIRVDSVSRRTVLKGIAGAAGLVSIPAIIAACLRRPRHRPRPAPQPGRIGCTSAPPARRWCERGRRERDLRFELLEQGHRHEGHAGRRRCVHGQDRHRGQGQHGRPQHIPGPDQRLPAGHAGRHVHVVRRLPDALLRRAEPRQRPDPAVGERSDRTSATPSRRRRPATTASSTSSRSTTTRGSSSTARASSRRRATPSRRRGPTSRRSPRR